MPGARTYFAHQHGRIIRALVVVGLVQVPAGGIRWQFLQQEQMATLAMRRAGFTLMASVADDPAIQRLLPQIMLANKTVLTHVVFNALGGHSRGNNIFILRRQSS